MIYLRVGEFGMTRNRKRIRTYKQIIKKWPNSFLYELPFDYLDKKAWRKYLLNEVKMSNGKPLPVMSPFGHKYYYDVYIFGLPKELIDAAMHYTNGKQSRFYSLFPGYPGDGGDDEKYRDKNGQIKPLPVIDHGFLK